MLESKNRNNLDIKISDFGFSCFFDPKEGLDLVLGSPLYMAPEIILNKNYNQKVDIWSIGVISYMLMTGSNPFPGKTKQDVKNLIVNSELNYFRPCFTNVSPEAIDFIKKALTKDQEKRFSAKQLLDHPWI